MNTEHVPFILDAIADALLCVDRGGKVSYLNPEARRLTGWSQSEAFGRSAALVFCLGVVKSGGPIANPLLLLSIKRSKVHLHCDSVLTARNGNEVAIDGTASAVLDANGSMVGSVVIFREVSLARAQVALLADQAQSDPRTNLPNSQPRRIIDDTRPVASALDSALIAATR